MEPIPLARPDITDLDRDAVAAVLRTDQLSLGPKIAPFERAVASAAAVRHGVAVNSGTSGLHLIVRALGLGDGDEVVTTAFSFIASSNCLLFERVRPVFVDIDPRTGNLDPARIEAAVTPRTRAILAVDVFGHPADYDALAAIAGRRGLALIEDSCEALGARYRGRPAGSFGAAGCFAFYPNKQITTGEGGMIVTDDDRIAELCRSMRNQGRDASAPSWLGHVRLGYNYRLSDLHAALGLAQMRRLEQLLADRARVAARYAQRLAPLADRLGIELPQVLPEVSMSWFVYVVRLAEGADVRRRDAVITHLRSRGVGCNNYFPPIHLQPFYREMFGHREGDLPITESVSARSIALPFFGGISEAQMDRVAEALESGIQSAGA